MGQVDPAFIQEIEHRPKPGAISEADGIPLIDLSPLLENPITSDTGAPGKSDLPAALQSLVEEVEDACSDWGFFQVVNHGVPSELLEKLQTAAAEFFWQSPEEKRKVQRDELNPLGYYDTEHTKNVRDWKEVFDFITKKPHEPAEGEEKLEIQNRWPEYPPQLREACEEYAAGMEKLAFRLLELISLTLDLPANRLSSFFEEQTSFIRLNHYPPCPSPDLALGVGRHKDGGALTILAQDDVGGLDVKRKSDGQWVRVKPITNSFIINVGDIVQVWSNDKYESAEHRVSVNSERERFSIPYFFNPGFYSTIEPLEELLHDDNPAKYDPYLWADFFRSRRNSNFKKLEAENLQIYHFRKTELSA